MAAENIRCADGVTPARGGECLFGLCSMLGRMCTECKSFYLLFTLFTFISYQLSETPNYSLLLSVQIEGNVSSQAFNSLYRLGLF